MECKAVNVNEAVKGQQLCERHRGEPLNAPPSDLRIQRYHFGLISRHHMYMRRTSDFSSPSNIGSGPRSESELGTTHMQTANSSRAKPSRNSQENGVWWFLPALF
jgi:hypothetical protein